MDVTHTELLICLEVQLPHVRVGLTAEEAPLAATRTDREIIILSAVSQAKTKIMGYHLHVESKNQNK